uniref:Uncharacterized protein n=1 Tax=Triticum urartu TaxID=4572 RepID=A0A8R7PB07_TRIUA
MCFFDDLQQCPSIPPVPIMQNEVGDMVDLYVPRKWYVLMYCRLGYSTVALQPCSFLLCIGSCSSATNRIITAKDHASVQINIGHVDANGLYNGSFTTFALSGFVRAQVFYPCYPDPIYLS